MSITDPGQIGLYDSYRPGITHGSYRIDLAQTIAAPGATVTPASQLLRVQAPRFTLDPADIHTQYPPAGATGQFASELAQIVFSKRVLPWERDIPGLTGPAPWVALLVFAEGELSGDRGSGDYAQQMTVGQLLADPSGPVRKPVLTVSTAEEQAQCRVITFGSTLFTAIVPTAAELALLAHVRTVDPGPSATIAVKDPGTYSVVVGNRFPAPGDAAHPVSNIAHLVSLEGFGDLLTGAAPALPAVDGKTQQQMALVSLASWTFSCLADPAQRFSGLAQNLTTDASGKPRSADSLLLKLPVPEPALSSTDFASQAQRRLAEGHTALSYHTRAGDDAFAWYRGPLTPVVPHTLAKDAPFATSDAALAFDPQTGLFDTGLAAAWQIGRCLALADEAFATALMRVRVRAGATLEESLTPDPHARLAALFGAGVIDRIARATAAGGLAPAGRAARPCQPSRTPAALVRDALESASLPADPSDPDVAQVAQWLALAGLLYPVPFAHLVPDARMLPPETIRFFYLDPNWIGAMLDGAMSVGVGTDRELAVQQRLTGQLQQLGAAAALAYRAGQLGQSAPAAAPGPASGLLVRSAIASGWPGLTVTASAADADVALLRLDHLAPTVLLCLFNGVPDTVTIAEPHEGLTFGVDDRGDITLRTLAGANITNSGQITVYQGAAPLPTIRPGGQRTLNVSSGANDLVGAIATGLRVDRSTIGSAELALQMLNGPEQITFSPRGAS